VRAAARATFAAPSAQIGQESARYAAFTIDCGRSSSTSAATADRAVMSRSAEDVPVTSWPAASA
jgi:hypothetical protein